MKKSSLPAIFIWIIYGLTAACCLFLTAMNLCLDRNIPSKLGLLGGGVCLILLGFAVKGLGKKIELQPKALTGVIIESLLVLCAVVFMVGYRILLLGNVLYWDVADAPLYQLAQIRAAKELPQFAHTGVELYFWLLRCSILFFGNRPEAAVILQMVLLVFASFGMYYGVRKCAGGAVAVLSVLFIGVAPYMVVETCRISPLLLVLGVYGIALGFVADIPGKMSASTPIAVLHYILTGMLIGIVCYLDVSGITLLVFLTGNLCFMQGQTEGSGIGSNLVFAFLNCILMAVAGFVGGHFIRSLLSGPSVMDSIAAQLHLYRPAAFSLPITVDLGVDLWDGPVLVILMSVGIFSFWICRAMVQKGIWLFAAGLLFFMQCMHMNSTENFNAYVLLYLMCVVMGGISVVELFGKKQAPASAEEEQNMDTAQEETTAVAEPENVSETTAETTTETTTETPPQMEIQYIENPLPLPKKKVHKTLDYDYEVADDDDFDI